MSFNSVAWKIALPVLVVLFLAIGAVAYLVPRGVEESVTQEVVAASKRTVTQIKTLRGYYTKNVIKKVLAASDIKPSFNHKNDAGAIPLPATLVHDLSEEVSTDGTALHLYSPFPFPNRKERKLDEFQRMAWDFLVANPDKTFQRIDESSSGPVVRVAVADRMVADACVGCHNARPDTPKSDWKLGDVRGVLEVSTHIEDALAVGASSSRETVLVLSGCLVLVVLVLFGCFYHFVLRRLAIINEALKSVADGEGDLTRHIQADGRDEIAELAITFNRFVEMLRGTIHSVLEAAGALSDKLPALNAGIETVSSGARRQELETHSIDGSLSEMAAAIDDVARRSNEAKVSVSQASNLAQQGGTVVNDTVTQIEILAAELESGAEAFSQLETDSGQIDSVLSVINSVAEQTNLLALNAAIEAARAGEHGRGFAVVADEVRTLATRTQKSTAEIEDMIARLQGATNQALLVMKGNQAKTLAVTDTARAATVALQSINQEIDAVSGVAMQIAASTEEQSATTQQIRANSAHVAELAQQSVTHADACEASASDIEQLAEALRTHLGRFKVT